MKNKILFCTLGITLSFLLLEAVFSALYWIYGQVQITDNRQRAVNEGPIRILAIGESTTAVAADEANTFVFGHTSYPVQLEKILNEGLTTPRFSVINRGVMSGDTDEILADFERNLREHRPHLVIAMMGIKDSANFEVLPENDDTGRSPWFARLKTYQFVHLVRNYFMYERDAEDDRLVRDYDDIPHEMLKNVSAKVMGELHEPEIAFLSGPQREEVERKLQLASYYNLTGQYVLAEEVLLQLIERHGIGSVILAQNYERQGLHQRGLEALKRAIDTRRSSSFYQMALGRYLTDLNRLTEAEKVLSAAVRAGPTNEFTIYELARVLYFFRRYNEAIRIIEEMIPLDRIEGERKLEAIPDNYFKYPYAEELLSAAWSLLGECYFLTGRPEKAKIYLEKAVHLSRRDYSLVFLLSRVYRALGEEERERALKERLPLQNKRLAEFYELAKYYKEAGQLGKIRGLFEHAKEMVPKAAINYEKIYRLAEKHGTKVAFMQYPTFALEWLKLFTPQAKDIYFIDNERIFDNGPPQKFFFEPRYPYRFNHYTKEGAHVLAQNVAETVREIFPEGADAVSK